MALVFKIGLKRDSRALSFGQESKQILDSIQIFLDTEKNMINQEHNFYEALNELYKALISLHGELFKYQKKPNTKVTDYLWEVSQKIYAILLLLEKLRLRSAKFEKKEEKWIMRMEYTSWFWRTKYFTNVKKRKLTKLKSKFRVLKDMVSGENEKKLETLILQSNLNQEIYNKIEGRLRVCFSLISKYIINYDAILTKLYNEEQTDFTTVSKKIKST